MDSFALAIECLMALVTLCGLAYLLLALWSARDFERTAAAPRRTAGEFAPDVFAPDASAPDAACCAATGTRKCFTVRACSQEKSLLDNV